eukprot:927379-Rhodomonas_salina.1
MRPASSALLQRKDHFRTAAAPSTSVAHPPLISLAFRMASAQLFFLRGISKARAQLCSRTNLVLLQTSLDQRFHAAVPDVVPSQIEPLQAAVGRQHLFGGRRHAST